MNKKSNKKMIKKLYNINKESVTKLKNIKLFYKKEKFLNMTQGKLLEIAVNDLYQKLKEEDPS